MPQKIRKGTWQTSTNVWTVVECLKILQLSQLSLWASCCWCYEHCWHTSQLIYLTSYVTGITAPQVLWNLSLWSVCYLSLAGSVLCQPKPLFKYCRVFNLPSNFCNRAPAIELRAAGLSNGLCSLSILHALNYLAACGNWYGKVTANNTKRTLFFMHMERKCWQLSLLPQGSILAISYLLSRIRKKGSLDDHWVKGQMQRANTAMALSHEQWPDCCADDDPCRLQCTWIIVAMCYIRASSDKVWFRNAQNID